MRFREDKQERSRRERRRGGNNEGRDSYQGGGGSQREERGPVEWQDLFIVEGKPDQRGIIPAVRVTESTNRGNPPWKSFTLGFVRDGNFIPTQHLRDLHVLEYLRMLGEAVERAEAERRRAKCQ